MYSVLPDDVPSGVSLKILDSRCGVRQVKFTGDRLSCVLIYRTDESRRDSRRSMERKVSNRFFSMWLPMTSRTTLAIESF